MRIAIRHEIVQTFAPPARSAIQLLRLRPRDCDSQHVAAWNIDVDIDCRMREQTDAYGNFVQTLDAEGQIARLAILAHGDVDTTDTHGLLRGEPERFPVEVFLRDSTLTASDAPLRDFAHAAVKTARTPLDRPHMLMGALNDALTLDSETSAANAIEAFEKRKGDARDFAHAFVAAARAIGAPARYVSGYLAPDPFAGAKAETASVPHAWAEAYVEGLGWIGFDATLCLCMHDRHVRVACGLDALDAAPVRMSPVLGATSASAISVASSQAGGQRQS